MSWDLLFHTQEKQRGGEVRGRACLQGGALSDKTSLESGVGCPSCPVEFLGHPRQEVGTERRSSVTQPIGQSSPLAGAIGYYGFPFPIIPRYFLFEKSLLSSRVDEGIVDIGGKIENVI